MRTEPELITKIASMCGGTYDPSPEGHRFSSGAVVWNDGDRVYLGLEETPEFVCLSVITAEPEGKGNGPFVLNTIKRYAENRGVPVKVVDVDNPDFFESQGFAPEPDPQTGEVPYWWKP